ncbi:MAG: alpha-N-arabinofuranosidase [Bacteroidales bacterium]|nr:alpha-N-arabinofuranosidase [Bacteroidales bacterium]
MKRLIQIVLLSSLLITWTLYGQEKLNYVVVDATNPAGSINRNIYGQFSEHLGHCIYQGIWVGEKSSIPNTRGMRNDVIQALKEIQVPVLRWPGGCFADEYHWKSGIGPRDARPQMINTNWGGVTEDNSFGTHEFLDFCELIGAEPYISMNVGSGTVEEASQWIEYINSNNESPMTKLRKENGRENPWNIKYVGIGNEPWGCGGEMRAEYYADKFREYSVFCKNYGNNKLFRIAAGYNTPAETEILMKIIGHKMDGMSLHYYTVRNWNDKGSATKFSTDDYFTTMNLCLKLDDQIKMHSAVMDKYDPEKKIALIVDEWGNWFDVEPNTNPGFLYQQNTLRDALSAATSLNILNNHCDRVKMANIAQMVNVLQALILTRDKELVLTPTYYVFKMFKVHQDASLLPIQLSSNTYSNGTENLNALNVSASVDVNGKIHITIVNIDPVNEQKVECKLNGLSKPTGTGKMITAENLTDYNDFAVGEKVNIKDFTGFNFSKNTVNMNIPAKSVICMEINSK